MACTPWKWFHTYVNIITTGFAYLKNTCHIKSGTCMTMILYRYFGMCRFDIRHNLAQWNGATDACHIFDTNLVRPQFDKFQRHIGVVLYSMNGRMSDTKRALWNHSCLFGVCNGRSNVAYIIQSAECTGDICTLRFLHFVEQFADIRRNGAHPESVQCAVEHMGLNACFVKWLCPFAHGSIRVFAKQ